MQIQNNKEKVIQKSQSVVIDPNPRKEREMLDKFGNVIDPRTKQIIRPNNEKE